MDNSVFGLALASVAAAYAGYRVYSVSGLVAAVVVMLTVAWLTYRVSSGRRAWDTAAMLTNPVMASIVGFLLGFSYYSFQGSTLSESALLGAGTGLLGGVLGMLLFKYWNIGG